MRKFRTFVVSTVYFTHKEKRELNMCCQQSVCKTHIFYLLRRKNIVYFNDGYSSRKYMEQFRSSPQTFLVAIILFAHLRLIAQMCGHVEIHPHSHVITLLSSEQLQMPFVVFFISRLLCKSKGSSGSSQANDSCELYKCFE